MENGGISNFDIIHILFRAVFHQFISCSVKGLLGLHDRKGDLEHGQEAVKVGVVVIHFKELLHFLFIFGRNFQILFFG